MINERNGGNRVLFGLRLSEDLYPRPLVDTWHHLRYRYPRSTWPERSLRKQVCLLYIQWIVFPEKENRRVLIEKVKEWRKSEPGRVGGKRSILEVLARKFFAAERRERGIDKAREACRETGRRAFENKTGIHAPGMRERLQDPEIIKKNRERIILAKSQHWWVFTPSGEILEVHNLREFCRQNNLDSSHLCRTAKHPGKTHKKFRARKRNIDLEGYTPGFSREGWGIPDPPPSED